MYFVILKLCIVLALTGSVKNVSGGIFPSSFYFRTVSETEIPQENSVDVDDAEIEDETESVGVSEQEFTALRIEYIKNQILKKLRLKEKPQITMADLPIPVKEYENLLPDQDMNQLSRYDDDFYGKTTQAIVLPYEDEARCLRKVHYPSACLPFQMPNDIHSTDVSTAQLWFHKKPDIMDSHNQTFIISEVAHWDTNKSFQKTNPIAIQDTNSREGWLKVDVTYVVKNWLNYQNSPIHAINVLCKTCGADKSQSPVSFSADLKPFLIIYTHSQQRGSKVMGKNNQRGSRPELTPCCAATQFQPLQLVYMDGNKTLTTKRLSNMIVETCGCM
ncbi:unnamed protein product [Ceutorhynchus assimilis]|uniref:TGF-beta family profile domain-containing protein n=1 Tax=Ceutorhynchus assimilis TaxID=467358 RepID=A0A9N9MDZ6_9CUCU|nr:unnamed protein product [Ceutorhynchus assimilis]